MHSAHFVDVVLPLALKQQYTYSIPDEFVPVLKPGMRVVVSFGKRRLYSAVVYKIHSQPPQGYATKDIIQVIDENGPIVLPLQIKLWEWIASYYMCSLGEVMKAALPSALKLESETYVDRAEYADMDFSDAEQQVIFMLDGKKKLTIQDILTKSGVRNPMSVIRTLIDKGAINVSERLGGAYAAKTEPYLSLAPTYRDTNVLNGLLDGLKRAPAQEKLIMGLLASAENHADMLNVEVAQAKLLQRVDVSPAIVKALVQKGVIVQSMVEVSRIQKHDSLGKEPAKLNEHQQNALDDIHEQFKNRNVTLLHGVTSSGKTEIYIHLINETLNLGKQVLYLLPEIALTAQIVNRLRNVFGNRVGVYHSKYGDAQRAEVYNGVLNSKQESNLARYDVILGVRSSIFMPFSNLGLIIVDEEHENTYKQNNPAPRYNARDVSVILAQLHGAKVLMGTATPSIESYHNAKNGKYGLVELKERYRDMQLPEVRVVDLRKARRDKKMHSHFSQTLIDSIDATLKRHEQVILFQNRRGFAPVVECADCGWVPRCTHCDVSLTYHKYTNLLVCHYCGFTSPQLHECLACGSTNLQMKGFGTEKVEDDLAVFFPTARIVRLDLDSSRSRTAYERIIEDFEQGNIDVLIGTQMVTKGLDFDRVSLVGILNADSMMNFPDFRAFEHSYQLMSQVSGRAGRKGKRGLVILQTSQPEHPVVHEVVAQDYTSLYDEQIDERLNFCFPPFCRLISVSLKYKDKEVLAQVATDYATWLQKALGSCVLGPEAPLVERVQNLFILEILVKIDHTKPLQRVKDLISYYADAIKQRKDLYSMVVAIDVDPM